MYALNTSFLSILFIVSRYCSSFKQFQIIGPGLHYLAALWQILGMVVQCPYLVAVTVSKLLLNQMGGLAQFVQVG